MQTLVLEEYQEIKKKTGKISKKRRYKIWLKICCATELNIKFVQKKWLKYNISFTLGN